MKSYRHITLVSAAIILFGLLGSPASGADIKDYCIKPPFIQSTIKPNLLLMIDNSASMYDPAYQDTANLYCANAPTNVCTTDAQCSALGNAFCLGSVTTSTSTTYSAKACTLDAQCPNSTGKVAPKTCSGPRNNNPLCPSPGSKCEAGQCTGDTIPIPPCLNGFCNTCNMSTGAGDCISSVTTITSPVPCNSDTTCSTITAGDICNNRCNATHQCYDDTFNPAATLPYAGYFDAGSDYYYDFTANTFVTPAALAGCTYSAGTPTYVCVNTTGSGTSERIDTTSSGFRATGNFLNWLTASRFDIEKQILTGGKFDTTNNVLIAESRGCSGRKFIKAVPGMPDITFAIHGGMPGGVSSTQSQAAEYGQTYIEIFKGTYNAEACQVAANDWFNINSVSLGPFQNHNKDCVGAGSSQADATNIWNHVIHNCYKGITGQGGGFTGNLNSLEGECKKYYDSGVPANTITDPGSAISVCSSILTYEYPAGSGNFRTGYLGACYSGGSFSSPCDATEMENFCRVNISTNPVVDPSSPLPASSASVPGFIMEQGLLNTVPLGELTVRVALSAAPSGLLQEFQDVIRFGSLTFNVNGSGSECGDSVIPCFKSCSVTTTRTCYFNTDCPAGETCLSLTKADGGEINTYISDQVGSHALPNTLISNIGAIPATTWTPFSEAYYSSIGYFARANAYSSVPATSLDMRLQTGTCSVTTSKVCKSPSPDASWNCPSGESCVTGADKGDYNLEKNPSIATCQKNFVLLITDGQPTADTNATVTNFVSANASLLPTGVDYDTAPSCYSYRGTKNLEALSWLANNRSIQNIPGAVPTSDSQRISTFVVYSGTGTLASATCESLTTAQLASLNGCSADNLMCKTARYGGADYFLANNPAALKDSLRSALEQVAGIASSGTAASVLASGEGSGANLVQSIFYPKRSFNTGSSEVSWIGTLANMWYYIDPRLKSSSIREDTVENKTLKLTEDRIVEFAFNPVTNQTGMNLFADADGDGVKDNPSTLTATATLDSLKYLWEAGRLLFQRTPGDENPASLYAPTARTVYTNTNNDSTLVAFAVSNAATLKPLLGFGSDATNTNASKLIRYIRGNDDIVSGVSSIIIDFNSDGTLDANTERVRSRSTTVTINSTDVSGVWKLGDTINSTPKLVSWTPLHHYDTTYNDGSYHEFQTSSAHKIRGMVFVGANDGMLHAFKLGLLGIFNEADRKATLGKYCSGAPTKACSVNGDCPSGSCVTDADMGKEAWAFIPKNTLPYLKYLASTDYCHLYSVDATPVIVDASIMEPGVNPSDYYTQTKTASSWRTVLIGSMRYGGACRSNGTSCSECVSTPIAGSSVGMSSYFALDITDPEAPSLLWEYANSELGLSSTGPAVVRISAKANCSIATGTSCDYDGDCTGSGDTCKQDKTKNGRWFVVVGTGPSGYVSPGSQQFTGVSEHNYLAGHTKGKIKLHVLDLKTGDLVENIDAGESAAFAGSFANATIDMDNDYSDDAIYFGFTARNTLGANQTAQAGSTATTIKLSSSANSTSGFYNGKFVHRTDGIHEVKLITDYDGTTKVAAVDSSWQVIPTGTTQYNIFDGWNTGGVKRLFTKESMDTGDWAVSDLIRTAGPVTTSVVKLLDIKTHKLRAYFGTGRNYFKIGQIVDDSTAVRRLYGVVDPCITAGGVNFACTTTVSEGNLGAADEQTNTDGSTDVFGNSDTDGSSDSDGWYIPLQAQNLNFPEVSPTAERAVTDPLATQIGVVFFTTSKPSTDLCSFGGKSYIWAVRYDTGGTVPAGVLKGKAMIQLSTGAIKEVALSSAFNTQGNRRTYAMQGLPPLDQGLNLPVAPKPISKILHMQKK